MTTHFVARYRASALATVTSFGAVLAFGWPQRSQSADTPAPTASCPVTLVPAATEKRAPVPVHKTAYDFDGDGKPSKAAHPARGGGVSGIVTRIQGDQHTGVEQHAVVRNRSGVWYARRQPSPSTRARRHGADRRMRCMARACSVALSALAPPSSPVPTRPASAKAR